MDCWFLASRVRLLVVMLDAFRVSDHTWFCGSQPKIDNICLSRAALKRFRRPRSSRHFLASTQPNCSSRDAVTQTSLSSCRSSPALP